MKLSSMRARMTLGLTLFIAALTTIGATALWARAAFEARQNADALLQASALSVRASVRSGASWEQIATVARQNNLNSLAGEVELWRIGPDERETGHILAPRSAEKTPPAPSLVPLPETKPPAPIAPRPTNALPSVNPLPALENSPSISEPAPENSANPLPTHENSPAALLSPTAPVPDNAQNPLAKSPAFATPLAPLKVHDAPIPPPKRPIPPLDDPGGWLSRRVSMGRDTILIGVPWFKTRRALEAQAWTLALLGLLTTGAAGVGAWVLVGRTLSPIARLSNQARAHAATGNDAAALALQTPSPDREMRELVATFNALLDSAAKGARQRESFHAAASHELRTPLQALAGTLQLALSRPRENDELRAALQNALAQSDRLNALTRDLLVLNQLAIGNAPRAREVCDVAQSCDLALSSLQTPLAKKALQLEESLPELELRCAPSHLEMLCRNLIENAVKYAPDGGAVRVETLPNQRELRVWNATQNPIEGDLNAWFEPFYRPDEARNSQTGGNGLGLAICQMVCHSNGWHLALEPTTQPRGVRAVVRF